MFKKILIMFVFVLFSISMVFSAVDVMNFSEKFEKNNPLSINSYNGFKIYEKAKVKVYVQSHKYETNLKDKWNYDDYLREFRSNYEGVNYNGVRIEVGNRFTGIDEKSMYQMRREKFEEQNRFKIDMYKSKSLSYTSSENYKVNDFN